jgi:hypothetical protein
MRLGLIIIILIILIYEDVEESDFLEIWIWYLRNIDLSRSR